MRLVLFVDADIHAGIAPTADEASGCQRRLSDSSGQALPHGRRTQHGRVVKREGCRVPFRLERDDLLEGIRKVAEVDLSQREQMRRVAPQGDVELTTNNELLH
jgi:hypothetical protein